MRYKEIIAEAFDQPRGIDWEQSDESEAVDAIARLSDGTALSVMFEPEAWTNDSATDWSVSFWRGNSQEVTGAGNAQEVFATVLSAIRQFVHSHQPESIEFSASKEPEVDMAQPGANVNPESRAKLYDRMVDRYAGAMGYQVRQQQGNNKVTYTLKRTKQGMAEGLNELANTSLKVKEPKDFVNTNDRKQVTYKVMKFKSGKDTYLINFTVKGAPAFGKKQNWNAVNVAFGVKEKQDDYSFGDEINTDLTARNKNQFLIYSTVINAVRKFITEYNTEIDEIIMQGAGERQEVMYQRFFQSAGKYFPGWHHDGKHSLVRDVPRPTGKKVREQGMAEAPLADYVPMGDFNKPGPFRGADKKLVPHPVNQLKAQRFFEKTPYNFRLFFSNIPGTGKYSEYGVMDPDTVKIIFGDAGEQIVAGHEDAITVVYVGNSGDSKVMLTPWMMAHRLGHAMQSGTRGRSNNQQHPWKAGEDHFFGQVNSMLEEYYGKSGQRGGNLKAELTPEYNALFNAIGTQRSSRSGEIRRPYEFLYEIFAQYLGTGTVTFNALPANLGYGRKAWGNPSRYLNINPEYRDESARKQATEVLSYDMELMFNDALSNAEGKIMVM